MSTFKDVTFSSGTTASGTHPSMAVTMPAIVNAGDVLTMFCSGFAIEVSSAPSGWTFVSERGDYSPQGLAVLTKTADGTEDGTTVNVPYYGSGPVNYVAAVHRMTTDTIDTTSSAGGTESSGASPRTGSFVEGDPGGEKFVAVYAGFYAKASVVDTGHTWGAPATDRGERAVSGNDWKLTVADVLDASGPDSADCTIQYTSGSTVDLIYTGVVYSVLPAAPPPEPESGHPLELELEDLL